EGVCVGAQPATPPHEPPPPVVEGHRLGRVTDDPPFPPPHEVPSPSEIAGYAARGESLPPREPRAGDVAALPVSWVVHRGGDRGDDTRGVGLAPAGLGPPDAPVDRAVKPARQAGGHRGERVAPSRCPR